MSTDNIELALELAIKQFIASEEIFSGDFPIHAGHSADPVGGEGDYLVLVAERSSGEMLGFGVHEKRVEFQLFTYVEDEDTRAAQTAAHADRAFALFTLWSPANFLSARTALNAPGQPWRGLGFTGWEQAAPEDGRTDSQLVARLRYDFQCHLE